MKLYFKYFILVTILISYQSIYSENKGLENCGNSCYFNASLQALSHLDKFNSLLQENLYAPDDLIPRFYINLMEEIKKGPGTISCNYKYTNLDNKTERNFYNLAGDLFFGQQGQQEDAPEFIQNLFKNIIENSSYYRTIKELIEKEIEPIFDTAFNKISPNDKKFAQPVVKAKASLSAKENETLQKIHSRFFESFAKGLKITREDLLTNILDQCIELLDRNPDIFQANLFNNLKTSETQAKKIITETEVKRIAKRIVKAKRIVTETKAETIAKNYIKTIDETFKNALTNYKNIQIDEDQPIEVETYTGKGNPTRKFTPTDDGLNKATTLIKNLSLAKMETNLEPIFNGINGTFWKFPEGNLSEVQKNLTAIINLKKYYPYWLQLSIPNKKTNLKELEDLESIELEKAFPYVIVWLKRYKNEEGKLQKNSTTIPFENQINLKHVTKSLKYNLIAFVVQSGSTGEGHYWAYGKDKDDKWWRYNDPNVTDASIEDDDKKSIKDIFETGLDRNKATPYVLFYELEEPLSLLKSSLQKLKTKVEMLQEKLGTLRGKLG